MLSSSWLRHFKRPALVARRRTQLSLRKRAGSCAPMEALEERCLFSTLTVTSTDDNGAGSLRAQIAAAQSGDTIVFSPTLSGSTKKARGKPKPSSTTTTPTITLTRGELLLTKDLTIQGPGAGHLTISGNYDSGVFQVAQGATVTVSGLTIIKGWGVTYGGGILNNGTLTVSDSALSSNGATYGGGICNLGGTLTITNSTLAGNYADGLHGGGIYNAGGAVVVSNTAISNNQARDGGGIFNNGGTVAITNNSTVSGNVAHWDYSARGGYGGGIYNSAGTVTISNSIVSGNVADQYRPGDGIYNAPDATLVVRDFASITGNTGHYDAGEDVYNLGVLYQDGTSTIGALYGNAAIPI